MDDDEPPPTRTGALEPGRNCWRIERADQAALIVDAANYFSVVREAMMAAEKRIMLIGWDFDARVRIGPKNAPSGAPATIGRFVLWLSRNRPDLQVYLLRWDVGAFKGLLRGATTFTVMRWALHRRIHVKLDGAHPFGGSHHQKIVVIDDSFAFCGGIDITTERWDTREHLDDDPRRVGPHGWPHGPWHDATMALSGPAARALDELARDRWRCASGDELPAIDRTSKVWPDSLQPDFTDVDVALARSRPEYGDVAAVLEIEQLYLDLIARARESVYIEGQYFASGLIAEAITRRLAEPGGPEFVIVSPEQANGWLEQVAMDTARARLFEAVEHYDKEDRFRIFMPFTAGGQPIYVHAKIMIVDGELLRVGSSNLNNRSLRLDTECDVVIDATLPANDGAEARIRELRNGLIAEHLSVTIEQVADAIAANDGSLIRSIDQLRDQPKTLRPYVTPELSDVGAFMAENELLDPNGPARTFEALTKRKRRLFRGLRRPPA